MIKVSIKKSNNILDTIKITGHANYKDSNDIVCAAVSSICITTVNAVIKIDNAAIKYNEKDGYLEICIVKHTEVVDKLINNMVDLLIELENDYSKYIKINK